MLKSFLRILLILVALVSQVHAASLLENAWDLLHHLSPQNTRYQHGEQIIQWPQENDSKEALSFSDCSGFMNALIQRSYELNQSELAAWFGVSRPLAKDYYFAILNERNFKRQLLITDLIPGDIVAVRYFDTNENTGHVMLAAGFPEKIETPRSTVEETVSWRVSVIDSSSTGHGILDTRYDPTTQKYRDGLGLGHLRIFTTPAGEILGYSWSESERSPFQSPANRHLVLGRIVRP